MTSIWDFTWNIVNTRSLDSSPPSLLCALCLWSRSSQDPLSTFNTTHSGFVGCGQPQHRSAFITVSLQSVHGNDSGEPPASCTSTQENPPWLVYSPNWIKPEILILGTSSTIGMFWSAICLLHLLACYAAICQKLYEMFGITVTEHGMKDTFGTSWTFHIVLVESCFS